MDQRSEEAQRYRRLYKLARWQQIRQRHLAEEPLCRMCAQQGITTAATVVDHVTPHKGDEQKFWAGPFQSLCAPCHDRHKQREERGNPIQAIGLDGWPTT